MTAIVSRVSVHDDGTTRRTRITVTEGRVGSVWTTQPSSVPDPVRTELLAWFGVAAPAGEPWRGEHGGIASTDLSEDAPDVQARTGFTVDRPSGASPSRSGYRAKDD